MRKTFVSLTLAVVFCLLALSTPYATRTVAAAQQQHQPDPCVKCQRKVQQRFEKCEARYGSGALICADEFNQGIVECYATVCEQ
ncbi:MAG TPA: hypothetical protein VGO96_12720 [Pyrinomonadaceae bacterium]|jgi:hypothetical protein|nr:hypothetical protein [Pyrinomonadaceae bacterium]